MKSVTNLLDEYSILTAVAYEPSIVVSKLRLLTLSGSLN
jgi:hypothetical protein